MDLVSSFFLSPKVVKSEKKFKTVTTIQEDEYSFTQNQAKVNQTFGANSHQTQSSRLKLKDYLRLTALMKKQSSSSIEEQEKIQHEGKSYKSNNNKQTIYLLKEGIKKDLKACQDQLSKLQTELGKMDEEQNIRSQHDEIVNLCEVHRIIKDSVQLNLEKCFSKVKEEKKNILMELLAKTKGYVDKERKKIDSPMRKRRKRIQTLKSIPHE